MKKLIYLLLFSILTIISCGKGDDSGGNCTSGDITSASTRLTDAATKYAQDQSKSNCESYKSALNNYINTVDGCPFVNAADVSNAKSEINSLTCQ